jgi:bifunctional UDP-N-acetylglucosamine pyrophosphorylase/glucosamine-1-phosphate N-acetyltransferase
LLHRVLDALEGLPVQNTYVVVGHGREQVAAELKRQTRTYPLVPVVQEPQLGTGHAVQQVKQAAPSFARDVMITTGDAPLLTAESLQKLARVHRNSGNQLTLLAATLENPAGYGRVITTGDRVDRIVEQKDASPQELAVKLVNTGIYCLDWEAVAPFLDQLSSNNAQGEFYLTDIVAMAVNQGLRVGVVHMEDPDEMLGVNSRQDLAECGRVLNRRTLNRLMAAGVTIVDPGSTMIGPEVSIGPDTILYPGCFLEGAVTIGGQCVIGPQTTLMGTVSIGDRTAVMHSVIRNSEIGPDNTIGPFAHIRDGASISHHVRIGNFVEVKNSRIEHHTNAAHLSYLGDTDLGTDVNIGAGTITANYDPIRDLKHRTRIEDGVKIGCNSVLVAPVTVRERSCVAAGSVITREVAPWALAIARPKQTELPDWVAKITGGKQSSPTTSTC